MKKMILGAVLALGMGLTSCTKMDTPVYLPQVLPGNQVSDVWAAFNVVQPKAEKQSVKFTVWYADLLIDLVPSSHIQGYARYRALDNSYDFHILSYSNLAAKQGYVWFVSDDGKKKYYMKFSPVQIKDKDGVYYNHPGGIQIVDHYLIVPVIPAYVTATYFPTFKRSAIVYAVDLRGLHQDPALINGSDYTEISLPYNEILRIDGIENVDGTMAGSVSAAGIVTCYEGGYMLGIVADRTLQTYISPPESDLMSSKSFRYEWTHQLGNNTDYKYHYQGFGLCRDEYGCIFLIGFDKRGGKDYADFFAIGAYSPNYNKTYADGYNILPLRDDWSKHITLSGASSANGAGIEIFGGKLYMYVTGTYAQSGSATLNMLKPKP